MILKHSKFVIKFYTTLKETDSSTFYKNYLAALESCYEILKYFLHEKSMFHVTGMFSFMKFLIFALSILNYNKFINCQM